MANEILRDIAVTCNPTTTTAAHSPREFARYDVVYELGVVGLSVDLGVVLVVVLLGGFKGGFQGRSLVALIAQPGADARLVGLRGQLEV